MPLQCNSACANCNTKNLVVVKESQYCSEISNCVTALSLTLDISEVSGDDATNTKQNKKKHPGFNAVCLSRWSLELVSDHFKTRTGQKHRLVDIQ